MFGRAAIRLGVGPHSSYVNVFIHSLLCLFVVLVILKVRVQLYRPINYWLCVVCYYSFSPPVFNLSALMCN